MRLPAVGGLGLGPGTALLTRQAVRRPSLDAGELLSACMQDLVNAQPDNGAQSLELLIGTASAWPIFLSATRHSLWLSGCRCALFMTIVVATIVAGVISFRRALARSAVTPEMVIQRH